MTYEDLKKEISSQYRSIYFSHTADTKIKKVVDFLDQLEADAELGRAVRLAIKEKHGFATYEAFDCFGFVDEAYALPTEKDIKDLLEWAKRVE